jgi:hypothetical protein
MPCVRAAEAETSTTRLRTNGPRSLIRTVTGRPVATSVTLQPRAERQCAVRGGQFLRVLRRLSIFASVFSLDAARAISAPDDHASVPFEVIANLVAKSVVATEFNATAINEFCSEIARAGNLRSLEE